MVKFTPREPNENGEERYRIEHNETTGWVVCERAEGMTKQETKVRWEQLQEEGLNPNLLRIRRES